MRFAKWAFTAAGIYGLVSLPPLYFIERLATPPITHPEYYYGFIGTALAFQYQNNEKTVDLTVQYNDSISEMVVSYCAR